VVLIIAIILAYTSPITLPHFHDSTLATSTSKLLSVLRTNISRTLTTTTTHNMSPRTPVYFVSHGGPSTMFDTTHPVYPRLQSLGREIKDVVKPRAILVVSAHWQADIGAHTSGRPLPNKLAVEINTAPNHPLLYDFYGFPKSYYETQFPHVGSAEVAREVAGVLKGQGVEVFETERGLDHGVFVPFKIMFDSAGQEGGLGGVPIVQMSLLADETDLAGHIRLGRALEGLREKGVCVVVSGMSVHNLRDFMVMARMGGGLGGGKGGYAETFDEALRQAVEADPGKRDGAMVALGERGDLRRAHPSLEHLVPIHVGVGAAGGDRGVRLWTLAEGAMAWAQFRFGEVEA
jgi:4,5-DOPA dioxygenase extradiol